MPLPCCSGKFAPEKKDDEVLIDRIHTRFIDKMIEFYLNDETLALFPMPKPFSGP